MTGFLGIVLFAFGLSAAIFAVVSVIATVIVHWVDRNRNAAQHEHQRSRRFFEWR